MKIRIDGFVLSIIGSVLLAFFYPFLGGSSSPLPVNQIANTGIALIFFFYGLKLSIPQFKSGLTNWKLHLLIQASTFVLFPLIVISFNPLISGENGQTIWLAFLFLAALPSTVTSSVIMVSIARGNVPAAIFNASISGLVGIAITPLWMGLFMGHSAGDYSLSHIYMQLITTIFVPILIGILFQRLWGKYARLYDQYLTLFEKAVILLTIYKSFSESFEDHIFSSVSIADFAIIIAAIVALFFSVYWLTGNLSDWMGFALKDRTTIQFCGSKKSLVHGTIFSKILFPGSAALGIVLLPILLYHAIQLFIVSILATERARKTKQRYSQGKDKFFVD